MNMKRTFLVITTLLSIMGATLFSTRGVVHAGLFDGAVDSACDGIAGTSSGGCGGQTASSEARVTGIVSTVIKILSILVGVVSVIMIIIGGFKYVISSGDANNTKSAKDTILYALIGLVIAVLAQVIVAFVLNKVK